MTLFISAVWVKLCLSLRDSSQHLVSLGTPRDAMPAPFPLEHRLCLGEIPVPLVQRDMGLEDLHNLCGGDKEDQQFLVVKLGASKDLRWLEKHLQLPNKFWRARSIEVPLLQELRKGISDGKAKFRKPGHFRDPRRPNVVVPLQVRGFQVLVQNNSGSLAIAVKPGEEVEVLQWFLGEFEQDLKKLLPSDEDPPSTQEEQLVGQKRKRQSLEGKEDEIIQAALSRLRGHSSCTRASWLMSRGAFKVVRDDSKVLEAFAPTLKKLRLEALSKDDDLHWERFSTSVAQGADKAMSFLSKESPEE